MASHLDVYGLVNLAYLMKFRDSEKPCLKQRWTVTCLSFTFVAVTEYPDLGEKGFISAYSSSHHICSQEWREMNICLLAHLFA